MSERGFRVVDVRSDRRNPSRLKFCPASIKVHLSCFPSLPLGLWREQQPVLNRGLFLGSTLVDVDANVDVVILENKSKKKKG